MKIYRLKTDVDQYQYFWPRADIRRLQQIADECSPQENNWLPPAVSINKPELKAGDFYDIGFLGGLLVVNQRASEIIGGFLTGVAELLPIYHEGVAFWLINVTKCLKCLDRDRTQWENTKQVGDKLIRTGMVKPAFYTDVLPESGLFKIPETCTTQILVLVRPDRPQHDDFVYSVEKHQLEGLTFQEIWSDEGS